LRPRPPLFPAIFPRRWHAGCTPASDGVTG
jgi:hypothetical protein